MYKERIETCGQRIKSAMEHRGIKQSKLCQLAKIPKSSLSLYLSEKYEPKQDRIHAIAMALNVSEAWLMGYDVPMQRNDEAPSATEELTPCEKALLDMFKQIPESKQESVLKMLEIALTVQK